jgi:membrane fusion protein, multidrug efflux system
MATKEMKTMSAVDASLKEAVALPSSTRARGKFMLRRLFLLVVVPALVALGVLWFYLSGGRYIATDNAYVGAQKVLITPDISGKVKTIAVREGQHVNVGDVLFEIDPASYETAVAQVEARLAGAEANYQNLRATFESLAKQIDLANQLLTLRQADLQRKNDLLSSRSGSKADVDSSQIAVAAARTQLELLQQQYRVTLATLRGRADLPVDEFPAYMEAKAALDQARRDLANTVLKAPISGIATQVTAIQMGRRLSAGTPVFSIVSDTDLWIDANPKETDITFLRIGQPVSISVDTFPDRTWQGEVAAISPGTGAEFAILPPQNASGNWVKVVQRVPVRIAFSGGQSTDVLRAGMSAIVKIDTGRQRSLPVLLGLHADVGDRHDGG